MSIFGLKREREVALKLGKPLKFDEARIKVVAASTQSLMVGIALLFLLLWGCPQGKYVRVQIGPPTEIGPGVIVGHSQIDGHTWAVVLDADGPGDVPIRLNGTEVRGCAHHGLQISCRFLDLPPGDVLLEAGSGEPSVTLWSRVGPFDWRQAILYSVIPDRFRNGHEGNSKEANSAAKGTFHGGDWVGLRQYIPYLQELGVNALLVTPIVAQIKHPVSDGGTSEWGYHGYWADDFTSLEPRLGTEDDLVALVSSAWAAGLWTLIDVVVNNPGQSSSYTLKEGWTRSATAGTCPGPEEVTELNRCVDGLPDFRTERKDVQDYLIDAHTTWLRKTGADGFRVDGVRHVEPEFLARLVSEAKGANPNAFLLGDAWGASPLPLRHHDGDSSANSSQGGEQEALYCAPPDDDSLYFGQADFDGLLDFEFADQVSSFLLGSDQIQAMAAYLQSRNQAIVSNSDLHTAHHGKGAEDIQPQQGRVWAHFLNTHHTTGLLHQLDGDAEQFRLGAILQMTVAGLPVILYGDEVGRRGGEPPQNRSSMPPEEQWDKETLELYRTLIRTRRLHPALTMGKLTTLQAEGDLLVFQKSVESARKGVFDLAIVAINRGEIPLTTSFELTDELTRCAALQDVLSQVATPVNLGSPMVELEVPPQGALLLVTH